MNEVRAFQWYKRAALQEDLEALYMFGYCFEKGIGTPKDIHEAIRWCRKVQKERTPQDFDDRLAKVFIPQAQGYEYCD